MSFPRYPAYKDSGVEWLGQVPSHWRRTALKFLGHYQNGYPFKPEERGDQGLPIIRIAQLTGLDEPAFFAGELNADVRVEKGDLLFTWSATIDSFIWQRDSAWLNQHIFKVTPTHEANKAFLFYVIKHVAPKLAEFDAHGSTMRHIKKESLGEPVYVPSVQEQTAIATFLDVETAKIDALVAEQQRLIELLKEKRQAVISHTVTKGLNPNAPMKPSGVEWLGDVPEHWALTATKRLFRLVAEPAPDDNDYELLSIYTEIGVRPRKSLEAKGNKATTTDGYWIVKKGDLIVNKLLAWMGAIGISNYDGVTSPAYDILRQRVPLEPLYYDYLFRCGICFSEFRRYSRGIMDMRLRLYFDELGQLTMPFPPLAEQIEIIDFLEGKLGTFDVLTIEAQRAIDLLQERRSALISAAVTGQIDVRGIAVQAAA